jgi:hypothetical protein
VQRWEVHLYAGLHLHRFGAHQDPGLGRHLHGQRGQVHRRAEDFRAPRLKLGQVQGVVDQDLALGGALLQQGRILDRLVVTSGIHGPRQGFSQSDHGIHRCAQFMGYGGQEPGFQRVQPLQFADSPGGQLMLGHGVRQGIALAEDDILDVEYA